jgi:hypothetical protein
VFADTRPVNERNGDNEMVRHRARIAARATERGQRTFNPPDDTSGSSLELRDDRRDVVVLFLKTESPNTIHDCGQQSLARQVPMLLKRFNQVPLAEFFSSLVTGFGDPIGVERKHVPGKKLLLPHRAIPLSEQSEQRAGGLEPIHLAIASYQET